MNTRTESPDSPLPGHSTCTASKAAGHLYGASRNTKLVIVKMPDYSMESILEIFWTIHDHIRRHYRQLSSVISISWGSDGFMDNPTSISWGRVAADISMIPQSVPLICAAGNDALEVNTNGQQRLAVDTWPAKWAQNRFSKNVLAVGNVNIYGMRYPTSQVTGADQLHAPGVDITCARYNTITGTHKDTGTSYCKNHYYPMMRPSTCC